MPDSSLQLILRAADFAAEYHQDQTRKGARKLPYINHPLEVGHMLAEVAGIEDAEVLAAALLHDTVEDTPATPQDILEGFGPRVAKLVAEVTDDKSLPKAERKRLQIEHSPHLSPEAGSIKIADKIANVRDLVRDAPPDWPHDRLVAYMDWAEAVIAGIESPSEPLMDCFREAIAQGRASLKWSEKD